MQSDVIINRHFMRSEDVERRLKTALLVLSCMIIMSASGTVCLTSLWGTRESMVKPTSHRDKGGTQARSMG